jgi:hypothetical protein
MLGSFVSDTLWWAGWLSTVSYNYVVILFGAIIVHTDIKNVTTLKVIRMSSNKLYCMWGSKPNTLIFPKRAQKTK